MENNLKNKIKSRLENLSWRIFTAVILTLTVVITVWVYAAFVEPTAGPTDSDQDFVQNILGANNADNDFNSSLVAGNNDGSIIEQLEYLTEGLFNSECVESDTSTQTNCYVDDTVRYLTTDLCNETKENSCFIPTDNSYYAFGTECADSETTAKTNCYVDDTPKYVDTNACSNASNDGYCFMNTANFSDKDADLVAGNIKDSITIFGVTGTVTVASAKSNPDYPDLFHIAAFIEPSASPADYDQDFTQNILGANNADNDFNSSSVAANNDGSIIERLKYLISLKAINARFFANECDESTTTTQTNCYVDNTARYLTTDLCNAAKENQCFVATDNGYYAFDTECSDSDTSTQTNCYVDDTARYVDTNVCSADSNTGYCYMNTATFVAMDAHLVAANIVDGITIFGVAGTFDACGSGTTEGSEVCDDGNTSWTVGNCAGDCSGINYWSLGIATNQLLYTALSNKYCQVQGYSSCISSVSYYSTINSFIAGLTRWSSYYYGTAPAPVTTWQSSSTTSYSAYWSSTQRWYYASYSTSATTYLTRSAQTRTHYDAGTNWGGRAQTTMGIREIWCAD